jgi:CelD/BcsL family acetyltransferase involved in cellulose biosynthesis
MSVFIDEKISYDCCQIDQLTQEHITKWHELLLKYSYLKSPFLTPEYHKLIHKCGQNVFIGLILKNEEVIGFFPFEKYADEKARPVGSIFCDYQCVIVPPQIKWSPTELLNACSLKEYYFDHQLLEQSQWQKYAEIQDVSWCIDLKDGYKVYEKLLKSQNKKLLEQTYRKKRKLEREVGNVTFTSHINDEKLLCQLLEWKSNQWAESGWAGRFKEKWEQQLMKELMNTQTKKFGGLFSVLSVNDIPIAMHIGLYSSKVWHYWTTAYDQDYKKYSPGIIMLVEMIKCANDLGFDEIDMGKEAFRYKKSLYTHNVSLCEGKINLNKEKIK